MIRRGLRTRREDKVCGLERFAASFGERKEGNGPPSPPPKHDGQGRLAVRRIATRGGEGCFRWCNAGVKQAKVLDQISPGYNNHLRFARQGSLFSRVELAKLKHF